MINFTAIDFEIANHNRGSVCAVGLARVRDGKVVGGGGELVRPPAALGRFTRRNIEVHGITKDMVVGAPSWGHRLRQIVEFVGDDILVAHNAAFDMSVIRAACDAEGIAWPTFTYGCSLVLARKAVSGAPSFRLPDLLAQLGGGLDNHHEAHADAIAAAEVTVALMRRTGTDSVEDLARRVSVTLGQLGPGHHVGCRSGGTNGFRRQYGASSTPAPSPWG